MTTVAASIAALRRAACQSARIAHILASNKTRQGYARERILKPAGYFFVRPQRGMRIDDPAAAEFCLQHLNYYRLGAYWLPFEADHATHAFRPGTRFAQVLNLYVFDRELRLLVLDAIERVEVSVRSQWAYQLAHQLAESVHLARRGAMTGIQGD